MSVHYLPAARVPSVKAKPKRSTVPFWVALVLVPVVLPVWLLLMIIILICRSISGLIRLAIGASRGSRP